MKNDEQLAGKDGILVNLYFKSKLTITNNEVPNVYD
jgi:hypothetical protein